MSRFAETRTPLRLPEWPATLHRAVWPASCLLLGVTACTFGPIEYVTVNVEPQILNSVPSPDADEVVVPEGGKTLYVVVKDDDLDYVSYTWSLSESGRLGAGTTESRITDGDGYPIEEANVFHLEALSIYDGQELSWELVDLDTGVGGNLYDFTLTYYWTVRVL